MKDATPLSPPSLFRSQEVSFKCLKNTINLSYELITYFLIYSSKRFITHMVSMCCMFKPDPAICLADGIALYISTDSDGMFLAFSSLNSMFLSTALTTKTLNTVFCCLSSIKLMKGKIRNNIGQRTHIFCSIVCPINLLRMSHTRSSCLYDFLPGIAFRNTVRESNNAFVPSTKDSDKPAQLNA